MSKNPRFQKRENIQENVAPLIVKEEAKEDVKELDADMVEKEVPEKEESYSGKEYLTFTKGTFKQVFRVEKDGTLSLVKTIPLTVNGAPAQRKFKLRPISVKMRGQQYETTYHLCPKEGIGYKFVQRNGEWDKVKDPKKETVVAVDDETAMMLETMSDRFEEVVDRK